MFPVIFHSGPHFFFTYPLIFAGAFFLGLWVWIRQTRKYLVPIEKLVNFTIFSFLWGVVGARTLFILTRWSIFRADGFHFWALWEGGLVFFGGFATALLYLYWSFPRNGISRRIGFDTAAPALAFAHAVGRVGCFANGCCYGTACRFPWGFSYRDLYAVARPLDTPLHPVQLYEAVGLGLIGWLLVKNNRLPKERARFSTAVLYLFSYGCLRFCVEFFRGDSIRGYFWRLSVSQWLSLGVILTALMLDLLSRQGHKLKHES